MNKQENSKRNIEDLVKEAQAGKRDAFSKLIHETQAKLFKFCILMGQKKELAEDVCQEVYIKAFKNIKKLKSAYAFQSWLYTISKNIFLDTIRLKDEQMVLQNFESKAVRLFNFSDHDEMDKLIDVQKILMSLPAEDRFLILLIDMEGYSYKEAAEITELNETTVRSRLHKLRKILIDDFQSEKNINFRGESNVRQ